MDAIYNKVFSVTNSLLLVTDIHIYAQLRFYYKSSVQIICMKPENHDSFSKYPKKSNEQFPITLPLLEFAPE